MGGQMGGKMDEWVGGWKEECIDRWMDMVDGWGDGWTGG